MTEEVDWKPGDMCGSCGSTDTIERRDGQWVFGHCLSCGKDDEDE